MLLAEAPIISIKEARKLLGRQYRAFTDEQIEDIITMLYVIAKDFVQVTVPN